MVTNCMFSFLAYVFHGQNTFFFGKHIYFHRHYDQKRYATILSCFHPWSKYILLWQWHNFVMVKSVSALVSWFGHEHATASFYGQTELCAITTCVLLLCTRHLACVLHVHNGSLGLAN